MKKEILDALDKQGYKLVKRQGSADTFYHVVKIGRFSVFIYISYQTSVIIESAGNGSYFINIAKTSYSTKDVKVATIIKQFKKYIKAVKSFERQLDN